MTARRRFRFGVQVTQPVSAPQWHALVRQVEDLGYATLFLPDHFREQLAPVPALAAAAMVTERLRVGTLVLSNDYRHPAVLAKEAATLDVLSGGRFELGLGAGWAAREYERLGLPFDRPGVRISRLAEALTIVRGLFGPEPVTFHGEHYDIDGLVGQPQPVQPGGPPLLVGGGGKRVLSLAARNAAIVGINFDLSSGVNLNPSSPEFGAGAGQTAGAAATSERIGWVAQAAGERFDDLELNVRVYVTEVTRNRANVATQFGQRLGLPAEETLAIPHVLIGTVDEIVADLVERREAFGLSYVVVGQDALLDFAPVVEQLAGA